MCKKLFNAGLSDSNTHQLSFLEYSDDAVITVFRYIYGVDINLSDLSFKKWVNIFEFANFLQITSMLPVLDKYVPADSPLDELINFAYKYDRSVVMIKAVRMYIS
jgi:hypothetical protein